VLCALPGIIGALPVSAAAVAPTALQARILASADHPYQGYVSSEGALDLPELPQLAAISSLLGGVTTMRTWYAGPDRWRTDVDSLTGEQDTYGTSLGTVSWDFETGRVTGILGDPAIRLPRPQDVVPAQLALRLLHTAGPADRLLPLPVQRVAGIAAAGLEMRPAAAGSTIGRIDIWADPATGVPLQVEVYGRGSARAALTTRFLDVKLTSPAASDVTFSPAPGLPVSVATSSDVTSLLDPRARIQLPPSLAGLPAAPRLEGYGASVSGYGSGFSTFAVLYLADQLGDSAVSAAKGGGAAVTFGNSGADAQGEGWLFRTPLLSVLIVRNAAFDRVFLLAGFTTPDVLIKAAGSLLSYESAAPPFRISARSPCPVGAACPPVIPGGTP
jgi:hypothetical protein